MNERTRGFEIVSRYLPTDGIKIPVRKTERSAGYDLCASVSVVCPPKQIKIVPTGLKAYMLHDEVLNLYVRSSIAIKQGLTLVNSVGIIDADYYNNEENEGEILVALYNITDEDVEISKGTRIAQAVFAKFLTVDNDNATGKRKGGIGSTDEQENAVK